MARFPLGLLIVNVSHVGECQLVSIMARQLLYDALHRGDTRDLHDFVHEHIQC